MLIWHNDSISFEQDQASERKKTLKDLDLVRSENTKLNDLEEEQKKNAEALLQVRWVFRS